VGRRRTISPAFHPACNTASWFHSLGLFLTFNPRRALWCNLLRRPSYARCCYSSKSGRRTDPEHPVPSFASAQIFTPHSVPPKDFPGGYSCFPRTDVFPTKMAVQPELFARPALRIQPTTFRHFFLGPRHPPLTKTTWLPSDEFSKDFSKSARSVAVLPSRSQFGFCLFRHGVPVLSRASSRTSLQQAASSTSPDSPAARGCRRTRRFDGLRVESLEEVVLSPLTML